MLPAARCKHSTPRLFQPELSNPVLDVRDVQLAVPLQGQDAAASRS